MTNAQDYPEFLAIIVYAHERRRGRFFWEYAGRVPRFRGSPVLAYVDGVALALAPKHPFFRGAEQCLRDAVHRGVLCFVKEKKCGCRVGPWGAGVYYGVRVLVRSVVRCLRHGSRHFLTYDEVRLHDEPTHVVGHGLAAKVMCDYVGEEW